MSEQKLLDEFFAEQSAQCRRLLEQFWGTLLKGAGVIAKISTLALTH